MFSCKGLRKTSRLGSSCRDNYTFRVENSLGFLSRKPPETTLCISILLSFRPFKHLKMLKVLSTDCGQLTLDVDRGLLILM